MYLYTVKALLFLLLSSILNIETTSFPSQFTKFFEVIHIDIEIKPRSRAKENLNKMQNKMEDILFNILLKIPEKYIPTFLLRATEAYIAKRTQELQQQIIKQKWHQASLEKIVLEIHSKHDK